MKHFFIVGAQRSGSTFLANFLDAHPSIEMAKPIRPEPKFFLDKKNHNKGIHYYQETFFSPLSSMKIFGEKSTSYIERVDALRAISETIPDAQIIFILRDPVYRAWSNYKFSVQSKIEEYSFEDALRLDPSQRAYGNTSVNPFDYLARGHCIKYIRELLNFFSRENIRVEIFEDLVATPTLLNETLNWLGVETRLQPNISEESKNSVQIEQQLKPSTKLLLEKLYSESNKELEVFLNRSIDCWNY